MTHIISKRADLAKPSMFVPKEVNPSEYCLHSYTSPGLWSRHPQVTTSSGIYSEGPGAQTGEVNQGTSGPRSQATAQTPP